MERSYASQPKQYPILPLIGIASSLLLTELKSYAHRRTHQIPRPQRPRPPSRNLRLRAHDRLLPRRMLQHRPRRLRRPHHLLHRRRPFPRRLQSPRQRPLHPHARSMDFPASNPETAGASAPPAGSQSSKPEPPAPSSSKPPTRTPSKSSPLTSSSSTPSSPPDSTNGSS